MDLAGQILPFKFSFTPSTFVWFPDLQQILYGLPWHPEVNLPSLLSCQCFAVDPDVPQLFLTLKKTFFRKEWPGSSLL